ncbi:FAD-dependent oxidoreductase [Paracoccus benzoatiresistens]|uniref:D-amino-acid oxidase n=1 Tax=Paracoccus benzoatiresistens TaxID=2997341 RepID=A0ABT4JA63_9RHOB|nr:FAD-dependent oxidoreductase [Paracoccus sp. EF6]MCZ0963973.1 FAD-dependent oxidoreductase [Paracoccus sp. EF6]
MTLTILGGGVMGLCIATELTRRGIPAAILDEAPSPQACSWWAGGMLAPYCEGESANEAVLRHGLGAADWWQAQGVPVTRNGTLVVSLARDAGALARFARRSRGHRMLDAPGIAALEPDLGARFSRALFFEPEAHLAPRQALAILSERLGRTDTTAGTVIDCRGLSAREALRDLRGVRGEMVVIRCPEITLSRPIRLLHPRMPLYVVPRGDGVFMLGATMVESDRRGRPTARAVLELLSAAFALHPALAEAEVLELGADARPAFPDNLPRIRRVGGVIHANGLYRHGFLLAPAVAGMVADHLQHQTRPEFMDADHD